MTEWAGSAADIAVAFAVLLVPGLVVLSVGWRWSVRLVLLAPALSLTILALSATAAGFAGLPWSPTPVVIVTALLAAVAFGLRMLWKPTGEPDGPRVVAAALAGLAIAVVVLSLHAMRAFISPDNIAQTFDTIVHLNSVALAVADGNASAFVIVNEAGAAFYPNAWASTASLIAIVTGASVPAAANAASIAISALVWPASSMALAWSFFRARPVAVFSAGVLSASFGAFPWIPLFFGVLYPNLAGYAMIPAILAEAIRVSRRSRGLRLVPDLALVALLLLGLGLAHPNAVVAVVYIGSALALFEIVRRLIARPRRGVALGLIGGAAGIVAFGLLFRGLVGTSEAASRWPAWQEPAQAFGEAILAHPAKLQVSILVAILLAAGVVTAVRHPRYLEVLVPFVVGVVLFVAVAGYPEGTRLREFLTNPWYNDPYRLAALLGVVAVPVATLGVVGLVDGIRAVLPASLPRWVRPVGAAAGAALVVLSTFGSGVQDAIDRVQRTYAYAESAYLLSDDERALLDELDELTPPDALIAGSPRTGASLALSFTDRAVMDFHIFGRRTDAETYIDERLRDIDVDPAVCDAVRETGVDYVLDFGDAGVGNVRIDNWDGLIDLVEGDHLTLVASVGDAKLFAIEGC